MALHVWLVEGSKIILNIEQILKVPILATIYNDWLTILEVAKTIKN